MTGTGKLVRLRALQPADYARWLAWINDPAVMDGLDRARPATSEQHERYVHTNVTENQNAVWFAIQAIDGGDHVGIVWLWDVNVRHRRAEVRVLVSPQASRRGYGTEALALLSRYAFETMGLHKLYAYVHERNAASRSAFERAGFALETTLHDEAFWNGRFAAVWRFARLSGA